MRKTTFSLLLGCCCLVLLAGCGAGAANSTATATLPGSGPARSTAVPPNTGALGGTTVAATAQAFVTAWEDQDPGALASLLTTGARSAWALGGGMGKWLADQRGDLVTPLSGHGRVLAAQESGGTGVADVAVAYPYAADCVGDRLPDWPPVGSAAVAARLLLERGSHGVWLVSYIDGADYLAAHAGPTRTVAAAATNTAYAASMDATRITLGAEAAATTTARTAAVAVTRTAGRVNLNVTATALWSQWFPQPTATPPAAPTK